jgi:hypothetical protein
MVSNENKFILRTTVLEKLVYILVTMNETSILSLFDTMLNFVVNLLYNERDPRQDE